MNKEILLNLANQFLATPQAQKVMGVVSDLKEIETPKIKSYTITGRVYNQATGVSLKGASITPTLAGGEEVKTDKNGFFSIPLELPIYPPNNKILTQPVLTVKYPNLIPKSINLLTQDRYLKQDVGTVGLIDIEEIAQQKLGELKNEVNSKINQASNLVLELPEKAIIAQRKLITKQIDKAQNILFPILIEMLLTFGVSSVDDLSNATCPANGNLQEIINKRNKLTKQINHIFLTITQNAALAYIYQQLSIVFLQIKAQVASIPIPLGAPLGVGVIYPVVSKLEDIQDLLKGLSGEFKNIKKQLLVSLIFLVAALILILLFLSKLDKTIQKCVEESGNAEDFQLEAINQQLQSLIDSPEEEQQTPFLNGFTIEVINTQSEVGSISRKQAIAKNSQGVILLKGEPSFSAGDQILIDELKYYIQANDLKAS